jgi:hypothetical protein
MRIVKNEKDWPTRRGPSQQMNDHLFYAGRSCGADNCLRQLGLREADVDYVIQQGRPTQKLRLVRNRRHEFLLNMCGVDVGGDLDQLQQNLAPCKIQSRFFNRGRESLVDVTIVRPGSFDQVRKKPRFADTGLSLNQDKLSCAIQQASERFV